jgi:hypothetical protein
MVNKFNGLREWVRDVRSRMPQDTTSPTKETLDTSQASGTPTVLPEAPASINLKVLIQGHEVMVTLRDRNEATLLARLQTLLKRQDIRPIPPRPAPKTGGWKRNQGR